MGLNIDYVTMPPKSQEVSQIQHGEHIKQDQFQQQMASQFQQQVRQGTEQTIRREKAENKEYRYNEKDRKGKGKKGRKNRNGQNNGGDEEEKELLPGESRFDMKV